MLDTIVATEAILLASFILMRQTRAGKRAEQREHLVLRLLLLTEREAPKLLKMSALVADRLHLEEVARDERLAALTEDTPTEEVAEQTSAKPAERLKLRYRSMQHDYVQHGRT